jgi:hypothetical protein
MAYEDLLKDTSESKDDGNYFLVTITDLDIGTAYPLQFRWKNKNGTLGAWSSVKTFVSESATIPSEPNLGSGDVVGGAGFITVTWNGNNALSAAASNFDRVNIHISGTTFGDGTKPAGFFKQAGTQTFTAVPGIYIVQLKTISVDGTQSLFSTARTVTVTEIVEEIQTPVAPTGFTSERILGGIEVAWAGTYGSAWTGFEAINIYAGTSSSATGGTYIKVGQMTANKISNKIVVPVDGTYVRYGVPVYIHASSVNRNGIESAISANVTSQSSGARSAIGTDLADEIISNAKLVNDAVTEAKIATSAITETKIATDAVTSQKIIANAITADKIVSSAITADKIATNAITAGKILAGEIDVTKLSAGTISVNNLESGTLSATSFIRAGTAGSSRIEISSAAVSASSILAGLYIYNGSTAVLQAPLGGGLTITGSLTATQISTSSGKFSVNSSGILSATDAIIDGNITADGGTIGGITIAADAIQNGATSGASTFRLDSSGVIRAGSSSGNAVIISPTLGIYHSANGGSTASGRFTLGLSSSTISGWTIGTSTLSSGNLTLNSNGTITTTNLTIFDTGRILNSGGFEVTAAGKLIATGAEISGTITASALDTTALDIASTGAITTTSGNFGVTSGGILSASSVIINGTLTANNGSVIGAWSVDSFGTLSAGSGLSATYLFSPTTTDPNGSLFSIYTNKEIYASSGFSTAAGSGAITFLSTSATLSPISNLRVNGAFAPSFDDTYSLGFTNARWQIVRSAGGVSTTSDQRKKTNIVDSDLGLDFINSLRPVKYKMISGGNKPILDDNGNKVTDEDGNYVFTSVPGIRDHYGLIAQEVKSAIDLSGVEDFGGWQLDDKNDPSSNQGLVYHQFIAPIIKAIQEMSARLDALEG